MALSKRFTFFDTGEVHVGSQPFKFFGGSTNQIPPSTTTTVSQSIGASRIQITAAPKDLNGAARVQRNATASISGLANIRISQDYFSQSQYRFRNDDGDERTATWKAPTNTPIVQTQLDTPFRVRFTLDNLNAPSCVPVLPRLAYRINQGEWTLVGYGVGLYPVGSAQVVDETDTTNQLGQTDLRFVAGRFCATGNVFASEEIILYAFNFAEYEFCVTLDSSHVVAGDVIDLTMVENGRWGLPLQQTVIARLHVSTPSILGTACIQKTSSEDISGVANVVHPTRTITGASRIAAALVHVLSSVSARARVQASHTSSIDGAARLVSQRRQITGNAAIAFPSVRTLNGKARIRVTHTPVNITGTAHVVSGQGILAGQATISHRRVWPSTVVANIRATKIATTSGLAKIVSQRRNLTGTASVFTASHYIQYVGYGADAGKVSTGTANLYTVTPGLPNYPGSWQAGDLLLVYVTVRAFSGTPSITEPDSWRLAGTSNGGYLATGCYFKFATVGDVDPVFTVYGDIDVVEAQVVGYRNVGGVDVMGAVAINIGVNTLTATNITTSAAYDFVVFVGGISATSIPTSNIFTLSDGSLTKRREVYASPYHHLALFFADKQVDPANTVIAESATSAVVADRISCQLIALRPLLGVSKDLTGVARITASRQATISGTASVEQGFERNLNGSAAIRNSTVYNLDGTSLIFGPGNVLGTARIQQTFDFPVLFGTASIVSTQPFIAITGDARIQRTFGATANTVANIQSTVENSISGKAAISHGYARDLSGSARIQSVGTGSIDGTATISIWIGGTLEGTCRITASRNDSTTGVIRVQVESLQTTQDGLARIQQQSLQGISGTAAIQNTLVSIVGTARLQRLPDQANITGRAFIKPVIAFVGAGTMAWSTTPVPGLPAGWLPLDLFLCQIATTTTYNDGTTITMPAGWTSINNGKGSDSGNVRTRAFYRLAQAGDTAPTVTISSGAGGLAQIVAYRNCSVANPVDVIGTFNIVSDTTDIPAPSVTTRADNELLVFLGAAASPGGIKGSATFTYDGKTPLLTERIDSPNGPAPHNYNSTPAICIADALVPLSGTATGVRTAYPSILVQGVGQLIVLKPQTTIQKALVSKASIYNTVPAKLIASKSRIRVNGLGRTITGASWINYRFGVTIQGSARLEVSRLNSVIRRSRVQSTHPGENLFAVSRIQRTFVSIISGTGRLANLLYGNITGITRIQINGQRSLAGAARLSILKTDTFTGTASINNAVNKTIDGTSRITIGLYRDLIGRSRVQIAGNRQVVSTARIYTHNLAAITGISAIEQIGVTGTITGIVRIYKTIVRTINVVARIQQACQQRLDGVGRIRTSNLQVLAGFSRVQVSNLHQVTGTSRITVTGIGRNLIGAFRIFRRYWADLQGTTRIEVPAILKTITGGARIEINGLTSNLTSRARIFNGYGQTITSLSRIQASLAVNLNGACRMAVTIAAHTLVGRARIQRSNAQQIIGVTRVRITGQQATLTSVTRIQRHYTSTFAGGARIQQEHILNITGRSRTRVHLIMQFSGLARVQWNEQQDALNGISRVQRHHAAQITGSTRIQISDARVLAGVCAIAIRHLLTWTGSARIQSTFTNAIDGCSRVQYSNVKHEFYGHAAIQQSRFDNKIRGTARITHRPTQKQRMMWVPPLRRMMIAVSRPKSPLNISVMRLQKFSTDLLDFPVNWTKWLATSADADTISSVEWIVPDGLITHDQTQTNAIATIWLEGGTVGTVYTVTCRMTSTKGRIRDFDFEIEVLEG